MQLNNKTAKQLKKDFPIFKNNRNLVYLDNSATTQKPKQVIEKIKEFYEKYNANVHRGVYKLSEKADEKYSEARKVVAEFVNASPEEIIFTKSSTDSLNLLSYTISSILSKGKDEILLTEMEHHSNLIPWQQLAKRKNMKLKFVKMKSDFTLDLEDAKRKITDKTAVFSFAHVSNVLGIVNPVEKLVKLAREKNIITIIDAAQSVPRMKTDIKKLDCDFLVFSGHKMLAPFGIGVLYGKKSLLEKLSPFQFGGGMIKNVSYETSDFADIPEKFEAGTQNIAGAIALAEAINYMDKKGINEIEKWEKTLTEYALKKLNEISGIEIYGRGFGVISFTLNSIHPHDIATLLDSYGIAVRGGHHCAMPLMKTLKLDKGTVRISFYLYNTFEDIDKLIVALKKITERFGK
ncbi:MAG: SufS family cysteine desulfurase [archaeon]